MADPKLVELLRQGSSVWNEWRKQQPINVQTDLSRANLTDANLIDADLSRVNLSRANLIDANLSGANLSRANLIDANLIDANLTDANLIDANLIDADLSRANLSRADLIDANLSGANLINTNLIDTNLSGADLSRANLINANLQAADIFDTIFVHIDLREVKGLAEVNHRGPSRVELHTVQLPQDGGALHFLRGCGIPNEWIDFYRATMMSPIQYHSCFISYSSKDEVVARRLHADLQAQGVRCWFAPEDMKIGDKIRHRIDEAIHLQEKVLLLLSEHALASDWVEDEVEIANAKERKQKREVLFPVRLDDTVMQTDEAWARKLRETRHIGNFTNWTDLHVYNQAFERLLRDLKKQVLNR